ncbi:hypothetical protein SAMN05421688_1255 [Poseidonocella pacifica]|uniref:Uncharacterized protein n=1 Tax=Poseidonocella pacifica TaxID=871651 RepID=A0A1I0WBS4_9RHOB|nr:hypothetical protein [Poseidonocella pacifica]SFA86195.1 hypothetical protein SAMN05421688_1255 [Poseidonocella pacifica]
MHRVDELASCDIGPSGLLRISGIKERYQRPGYLEALDRTTLWYDALATDKSTILICPKLRNLEAPLRTGVAVDGERVWPRIKRFARHDIVTLPRAGREVSVTIEGQRFASAVSAPGRDLFRGSNAALFISKDNDLGWIDEYIRYHRHFHDLQSLVVIDNASTAYSAQDLSDCLRDAGLRASVVLRAPFLYGPRGRRPFARTEKFLQTAMFNLVRLRYLAEARGVLSSDIDELLHTPGVRIFDHVQRGAGFVVLPKAWRYTEATGPAPQSAHRFKRDDSRDHAPKWAIRPTGPMGRFSWDTHRLEDFPANGLFRRRFGLFWHCHSTTTGWKEHRLGGKARALVPDPEMTAALGAVFGDATTDL